jgi:hypothetical protein
MNNIIPSIQMSYQDFNSIIFNNDLESNLENNLNNKTKNVIVDDYVTNLSELYNNIYEYLSFKKLYGLLDTTNSKGIKALRDKRFYINKNTKEMKCFDIPSPNKYISEEELMELINNNLDHKLWQGPFIVRPEIYINNEILLKHLENCVRKNKKRVRFMV